MVTNEIYPDSQFDGASPSTIDRRHPPRGLALARRLSRDLSRRPLI